MKKVLVTGADGFIGSHLTERLVGEGYEVKAIGVGLKMLLVLRKLKF
ncbi:NAD-dependent epimerase/dehydratase family protein [Pseudomonas aeruginosa]|nr:NAD-dependent epimerase/dehydratase family protein [Pseudomonas aeruginosa]